MKSPLDDFCSAVTQQLRCRWEAEDVWQELYDHLQDHASAWEEQGLSWEEAQTRAVAAMGDPIALGKALDRVHSPWPWRVLTLCRWGLRAVLALALFLTLQNLMAEDLPSPRFLPTLSAGAAAQELLLENWGDEMAATGSAAGGGHLGDYTLSPASQALLVFRPEYTYSDGSLYPGGYYLTFLVRTSHLQPWLDDLTMPWYGLSATDDRGNVYSPEDLALLPQAGSGRLVGWQVLTLYGADPAARRFTIILSAAGDRAVFSVTFPEGGALP